MPTTPEPAKSVTTLLRSHLQPSTGAPHTCHIRPDVRQKLLLWGAGGFSATAIAEGLKQEFGYSPHVNTIYKELKAHGPRDGEWTLADTSFSAEEARLILDELRYVIEATEWDVDGLTTRMAWWIVRLKSVRPELEPGQAYGHALDHVWAESVGRQLPPFDDLNDWQVYLSPGPRIRIRRSPFTRRKSE